MNSEKLDEINDVYRRIFNLKAEINRIEANDVGICTNLLFASLSAGAESSIHRMILEDLRLQLKAAEDEFDKL